MKGPTPRPLADRFWAKVDKSGECWVWTGAMRGHSYGSIRTADGSLMGAHRVSYEMAFGPIPEGMVVDHKCHVRHCIRPEHLQVVTIKQNAENRSGARSGSKSGVRGVIWSAAGKKWKGQVAHNYLRHHVGYFATIQEAEAAVIAKRNELHTNNLEDRRVA